MKSFIVAISAFGSIIVLSQCMSYGCKSGDIATAVAQWGPLLDQLKAASDEKGAKIVETIIGLLSGFQDALLVGDIKAICGYFQLGVELLGKLLAHIPNARLRRAIFDLMVGGNVMIEKLSSGEANVEDVVCYVHIQGLKLAKVFEIIEKYSIKAM